MYAPVCLCVCIWSYLESSIIENIIFGEGGVGIASVFFFARVLLHIDGFLISYCGKKC